MARWYDVRVKGESGEVVFLVRMWQREGDHEKEQDWRGSVHEIESGLRFYVTGSRDIADFIGARLAQRTGKKPQTPGAE